MIVIKGRSEKSIVLENLIRKEFLTTNIVVVDSVGVNAWSNQDWADIWQVDKGLSADELIAAFKKDYDAFKGFDWVVFYVNAGEDYLENFKELDRNYPQNFIVTIQGENGLANKYFI